MLPQVPCPLQSPPPGQAHFAPPEPSSQPLEQTVSCSATQPLRTEQAANVPPLQWLPLVKLFVAQKLDAHAVAQSLPVQPTLHEQVPLLHVPWPEQFPLPGQDVATTHLLAWHS